MKVANAVMVGSVSTVAAVLVVAAGAGAFLGGQIVLEEYSRVIGPDGTGIPVKAVN